MSINLIFNHHSLPFKSEADALSDEGFISFVKIILKLNALGHVQIYLSEQYGNEFGRIELAPGFFVGDWIRKFKTISKENQLYYSLFKRNMSKLQRGYFPNDNELYDQYEVMLPSNPESLMALVAAYIEVKASLISLKTLDKWRVHYIPTSATYLNNDGDIEEINDGLAIRNFFDESSISEHAKFLQDIRLEHLNSSHKILNNYKCFLPNLVLGTNKGQIANVLIKWSANDSITNALVRALITLNDIVDDIKTGRLNGFNVSLIKQSYLLDISYDSESTQNKRIGSKNNFVNIGSKSFDLNKFIHLRLPDYYRMKFYYDDNEDDDEKKIYIGKLGPHSEKKEQALS